jgi:dolichol-phosphate mannosyltransferase
MSKLSIIIPVYFNHETLLPLYEDIKLKVINRLDAEVELIFVDDGSKDDSFEVLKSIANNENVKVFKLSKNFGSHAAILCGLANCTGDCAVIKAADLQEPTELILDMYNSWIDGNKVVLAARNSRDESFSTKLFASIYYWLVRKVALSEMPRNGFDIYLIDRMVIDNLVNMDEKNSALTGQILWSGFKTSIVSYHRQKRQSGKSRWTLKKKIRLFNDTLYSFTSIPIAIITGIGFLSVIASLIWVIIVMILKFNNQIIEIGWTSLFIFNLFSFGVIMATLGLIGGYVWRSLDASRNRPVYIIEESISKK